MGGVFRVCHAMKVAELRKDPGDGNRDEDGSEASSSEDEEAAEAKEAEILARAQKMIAKRVRGLMTRRSVQRALFARDFVAGAVREGLDRAFEKETGRRERQSGPRQVRFLDEQPESDEARATARRALRARSHSRA